MVNTLVTLFLIAAPLGALMALSRRPRVHPWHATALEAPDNDDRLTDWYAAQGHLARVTEHCHAAALQCWRCGSDPADPRTSCDCPRRNPQ